MSYSQYIQFRNVHLIFWSVSMKKRIVSFLVNLLALVLLLGGKGCDKSPTKSPSPNAPYFPLAVGNVWQYTQVEIGNSTVSILDTHMVEDTIYYRRITYYPKRDDTTANQLYRMQDSLVYRRIDDTEYLYLNFTKPLGVPWQQRPYDRLAHIESRDLEWEVPAGTFNGCVQVVSAGELDSTVTIYAPNVGRIYSHSFYKKGAVIGGIRQLLEYNLQQ